MNKLSRELQDKKALRACAERFGVLGDETRLKVCWLLCRHPEMKVGDIVKALGAEQSTVSHALRKLKQTGVVSDRKESTSKFYSLNNGTFCSFIKSQVTSYEKL